ncbi:MAG: NAD(P)-dependent oxidoreductase, partial [Lachnospiraceae bacterium]|nr:NAD(P)-dependent oxidoreductase [Lachnospiraceae bacterium]
MKLGMIGMGVMGLPIAENLVKKSGLQVLGYDVEADRRMRFAQCKGMPVLHPEEVYENCGIVFFSLPNNKLVDACLGEALVHCQDGAILVDLSSSYPSVIQAHEESAIAAGAGLVDCPVSGGESAATAGTLSAMCGGAAEHVEAVCPYLRMFSGKVTHMGALGSGYAAKLINNMIIGAEIAAVAEAFACAQRAGLDGKLLFEAIRDGGAGSCVLEVKGPKMLDHDYSASSRLSISLKDQKNEV